MVLFGPLVVSKFFECNVVHFSKFQKNFTHDWRTDEFQVMTNRLSVGGRNRRSSGRFGRAWESVDIDLALKGLHGENI
ncbi:MAG: hypothetical protein ACI92S_002883, partial [Planctomycetaceae bacterium]